MNYLVNRQIEKIAKIRGRALRKLKIFLIKNPKFAGHSSRNISGIMRDQAIKSPLRQYLSMPFKKVTKMEESWDVANINKIRNPIRKLLQYPMQTNALKNKLPAASLGYGEGGVLFKRPKYYRQNPFAALIGSNTEMIMKGKVKVPLLNSIFIAPKKEINILRKKFPKSTVLLRKDVEKQFPNLISDEIW